MIERGKYQSLTMINWNGFFARTFDIDSLVTTLSGGNGAGKSTTMASFITSLIPDQSLLHFRNTTEAGSSQASRDKGLYGKLQPGVCYSALEVINSRNQRLMFVVKLQQVAGRDKKVDIKPLLIQGVPSSIKPSQILVESVGDGQARVRNLAELKDYVNQIEGAQFKAFNSIVDYHAQMFELGVLPKKLRNSSDRSKFYKLIEASLYGGISSAITKSLRDYLLPQNGGVKKAFQDMETALRENRATLDAINTTQRDRDLFKHLLTESTHYVAADYMRHSNERVHKVEQALSLRQQAMNEKRELVEQNALLERVSEELAQLAEQESHLEVDLQSASDHLQLMQTAMRQQQKIERYSDDLAELQYRLEEQLMVVEEAQESVHNADEQLGFNEEEVDSLKSQLADYQQALDIQQTRALQYQSAMEAISKASQLLATELDSVEQVKQLHEELKEQQAQWTTQLLEINHQLDVAKASQQQFDNAFQQLKSVMPNAERSQASIFVDQAIETYQTRKVQLEQQPHIVSQLKDTKAQLHQWQKTQQLQAELEQQHQILVTNSEDIELEQARCHEQIAQAQSRLEAEQLQRQSLSLRQQELSAAIEKQQQLAPNWIKANDALYQLHQQLGIELTSTSHVMQQMQAVMVDEKQQAQSKLELQQRRDQLEHQIQQLSSAGGANDTRLKQIADTVGGVLLSEIYDDIALDDAPYFSAMYGPARNAIVVSDLEGVTDKLAQFDDCPEDIYVIEGDVDAFDDSQFVVDELEGAVCVRLNEQQLRYSRFPATPLFGRAAREAQLDKLRNEREDVMELLAKTSFDQQKLQRLYQNFEQFVAQHLSVAFDDDPELVIAELNSELNQITATLSQLTHDSKHVEQELTNMTTGLKLLNDLNQADLHLDHALLTEQIEELEARLIALDESADFVMRHQNTIDKIRAQRQVLAIDPKQTEQLSEQSSQLNERLKQLKSQQFALSEVLERRQHFHFSDAVELVSKESELSEQLKHKLAQAESQRSQARDSQKMAQQTFNESNQVLVSLKSAHQAKQETLQEFQAELAQIGLNVGEQSVQQAEARKSELQQQLATWRGRVSELQRQQTACELELKGLVKSLKKAQKEYRDIRTFVVNAKAGWCSVMRLAKEHDVERRLHKREFAYLSEAELRSISDKSLGALRLAVTNDEELRDALRASEGNAYPERKVLFYIAVYQFLRQRIRQDIIHTDDPVEAIEVMEIELARLTDELMEREQRLAISSESVATIIKKTIAREQNRIRMLNQGLSNIAFGQVNGVRLNVSIRETHQQLLQGLIEGDSKHNDLFNNNKLTFSESMAKLFQRVNPHIDTGQRSAQTLGEELLDYRNYLELSIEVNRGSDGWLQAESGALSTGEAIGTGQSILLMVLQSWEEDSRRLRSKDIAPCRLLFLDEAARLDTKSIATLFELCERLNMQLLIAAPENISPDQGTTYKLVRKVFKDHEHVHVVGLKGFAQSSLSQPSPKIVA